MEIIAIIIGAIALYPLFFFVKDLYLRLNVKIDFDNKNVIIAEFISSNTSLNGVLAICFADFNIINSGTRPITVKEVFLEYTVYNKLLQVESFVLQAALDESKAYLGMINKRTNEKKLIVNWRDLRIAIAENKPLEHGQALSSGAIFLFGEETKKLEDIKNMRIVIKDFLNKKNKIKLKIKEEWNSQDEYFLMKVYLKNGNND